MHTDKTDSSAIVLRETNALISLPEICFRLREIMADPVHTRKDIADVMRFDAALVARLLRIVNSAYYALPFRVNSILQALGIIGEHELQTLVVVTSIVKGSNGLDSQMNITGFWKASVLSAVVARNLCPEEEFNTREEYFLAGLLLNIGKLPLYAKEPTLQAAVAYEMEQRGIGELEAEQTLTGTDHAHVGALLATNWNFPEPLCRLIASHHEATDGSDVQAKQQTVMNLANWLGDSYSAQQTTAELAELVNTCPFDYALLGLDHNTLCKMLQESVREHLEVYELFCGPQQ